MSRKRLVTAQWSTHEEHGSRKFDLAFWRQAGSTARFQAMVDLMMHYIEVSGGDPNQRLQSEADAILITRAQ